MNRFQVSTLYANGGGAISILTTVDLSEEDFIKRLLRDTQEFGVYQIGNLIINPSMVQTIEVKKL